MARCTDHDRVFDSQPLVRALNLQDRVHTFPSVEVSTFLRGHINPYPIYPDAERITPDSRFPVLGDGHVLPWWDPGWTVHRLFERMRELGVRIIQINHGVGSGQYFTMTGYDPATGMGNRHFSPKFDVFELVNGKRLGVVPELRAIAFSLWDRGHLRQRERSSLDRFPPPRFRPMAVTTDRGLGVITGL